MKKCIICHKNHKEDYFPRTTHVKKDGVRGVRKYCYDCEWAYRRDRYKIHKDKIRSKAKQQYNSDEKYRIKRRNEGLRKLYGITLNEYNLMLKEQQGKCLICEKHESELSKKRLYVDHDHITKKIRGLLCNLCNVGLGAFSENSSILEKAISYLKKNKI